jgi:hypothetical protein
MNPNVENITKLYDNLNYFDQYGGSLLLFIIITIIVILLIAYFHTLINIQPIIDDWPNQRCKPTIIPFAGFISKPSNMTAGEYTYQNFNYCTQNILTNIIGYALQPLTHITNSLQNDAGNAQQSIQSIKGMINKIRVSMQSVTEEIMQRLLNTTIPIQQMIISFKDLVGKIQGTMTAAVFTLLGSYYSLNSLMGSIAQFITSILIALSVMIAAFWAVPFTWGAAAANTAIFVAISIPMAIILTFMTKVLKVNTGYKIPKLKCFDKNTIILMNDGTERKIIDINVGDILSNNNIVTAKIKVETEGSQMFLLNNVLVSDSHIVKYNDDWIPVHKHPHAIKQESYKEPFLYCLNTTNKIININNISFTDWDEVYGEKLYKLMNSVNRPIKELHKYIDCGFSPKTTVTLRNGINKNICDIKINDVLDNGATVYGIVEIDGKDLIEQCNYNLGNNSFVEGFIPFLQNKIPIKKYPILYHLLTDKKVFKISNIIIPDYNNAIDRFLE